MINKNGIERIYDEISHTEKKEELDKISNTVACLCDCIAIDLEKGLEDDNLTKETINLLEDYIKVYHEIMLKKGFNYL